MGDSIINGVYQEFHCIVDMHISIILYHCTMLGANLMKLCCVEASSNFGKKLDPEFSKVPSIFPIVSSSMLLFDKSRYCNTLPLTAVEHSSSATSFPIKLLPKLRFVNVEFFYQSIEKRP